MENIEKKVADAILQRPSDKLVINGREYPIAPPTPATLILVSELVATIPDVTATSDNLLYEVLGKAKDLSVIGLITATLILGAKRIKEHRRVVVGRRAEKKHWSWKRWRFTDEYNQEMLEVDYLAELIMDNVSNSTLLKVVSTRIGMLQLADFFAVTTSLNEANLLRKTKEVDQTASGD